MGNTNGIGAAIAALFLLGCLMVPAAAGAATGLTFAYDNAGRLTEVRFGETGRIIYVWDKAGNLIREIGLFDSDTDKDGMADDWEIRYFVDLSRDGTRDDDQDGLSDAAEFAFGSDPGRKDTDNDDLDDGEEKRAGTNPNHRDTDADTMPDAWEVGFGLNPLADDAAEDLDNDGLTNLQEWQIGSDPRDPKSGPGRYGDLNASDSVDLADAVMALQLCAGIVPAQPVSLTADVSRDGKIGLEEALYILQEVSGTR